MLTRPGSDTAATLFGDDDRIDVVTADYTDHAGLAAAVLGVEVVVSAVSGVRPVIVDAQRALLAAAVVAGVPRFIPSDYSADYRRIAPAATATSSCGASSPPTSTPRRSRRRRS